MRKNEKLTYLVTALLACGLVLTAFFGEHLNNERYAATTRAAVQNKLAYLRSHLEGNLTSNIQLVQGVLGIVVLKPDLTQDDFEHVAHILLQRHSHMRNIALAPNMVIRMMYPLAGNEKAIGLDFRKIPDQFDAADMACRTRKPVLAGPVKLVQGGTGFISRTPVFFQGSDGKERFWGLISAVIDAEWLYRDSGLLTTDKEIDIAIRGKDAKGSAGEVFFGRAGVFDESPILADIALPYGSWQIAAAPRGGWPSQAENNWQLRLIFLAIALLLLGPFFTLGRMMRAVNDARAQADSERTRLTATLESTPNVAVQWYDQEGHILYWNHASEMIYGWTATEAIGKTLDQLICTEEEAQDFLSMLNRVSVNGEVIGPVEYTIRHRDGGKRIVSTTTFSIPGNESPLFVCIDVDITELKSLERAHAVSEARYRGMLESTSDWIWEVNASGIYTYASSRVHDLLGYEPEEVVGRTPFDFMPEAEAHRVGEIFSRIAQKQQPIHGLVNENRHRDGHAVVLETNGVPIIGADGEFLGYRGIDRDITERKQTEDALRRSEQKFRGLFESSPVGIALNDYATGQFLDINDALLASTGFTRDEFLALSYWDVTPKAYAAQEQEQLASMERTGRYGPYEKEYIRKDGSRYPVLLNGIKLIDSKGRAVIWSIIQDISERMQIETRLRDSEERFSFAVEGAGDGIWDWDVRTNEMLFSRLYMEMLGYAENEQPHHADTWVNSVHPDDMSRVQENLAAYFTGQIPNYAIELRLRCKDGSYKWILCRGTVVARDHEGKPIRMIGIHTDITKRKQVESELLSAREAAESANKAKSAFLSSMSHELRTPLNAIIGFAQMLDMGVLEPLNPEQKESVCHILNASHHLLGLINEVLDLARIESGRMDLAITTLALDPLVEEAIVMSKPLAINRQINILNSCNTGMFVRADTARVRQIFLNLLSNAVKYNRKGGRVTVSCQMSGDFVRITVTDTGQGIPEKLQPQLFKPFQRLGADRTSIEGTGIGLVITKLFVEAMGGSIGFESKSGIGSAFWVELPVAGCIDQALAGISETQPDGMSSDADVHGQVLYIEDSPANINVMKHLLRRLPNVKLLTAENAETGLAMIQENHPDLVLMDINLPGMSGLEALRILKSERVTAAIPVIAVSAAAMPCDVHAGLDAGFLAYLTKPFDIAVLLSHIRKTLLKGGWQQEME